MPRGSKVLNRDVCMVCVSQKAAGNKERVPQNYWQFNSGDVFTAGLDTVRWKEWNASDDMRWESGEVLCRCFGTYPSESVPTDKFPPEWCPYVAEHTVMEPEDAAR